MADGTARMQENLRRLLDEADARTRRQEVEDDVATSRGLTPKQCDHRLQAVVRAARNIRIGRDHPEELLRPDVPTGDFDQMWAGAVKRRPARE